MIREILAALRRAWPVAPAGIAAAEFGFSAADKYPPAHAIEWPMFALFVIFAGVIVARLIR